MPKRLARQREFSGDSRRWGDCELAVYVWVAAGRIGRVVSDVGGELPRLRRRPKSPSANRDSDTFGCDGRGGLKASL